MNQEEFARQQFITLRQEIAQGKLRAFILVVLAAILVPTASYIAFANENAFASMATPFVVLVLLVAFISEHNGVIRAGRYIKEQIEPLAPNLIGWERWLESQRGTRAADRAFIASFLLIFFLYYVIGAAIATMYFAEHWPEVYKWALGGYGVGGLWFLAVIIRHWRSSTTTR